MGHFGDILGERIVMTRQDNIVWFLVFDNFTESNTHTTDSRKG
ncbi:hypothetical protein BACCIP111883_03627 [Sutcliffiella rhizosphaerae]|uniref:Uncharacterized protein n=1 Tax=Sutcliffiella rhizosphaerae TaxID=2880967 RepID=A0ABM8YS66_9BACI|nr:hypothetical protein BACCIP111883_03627 [Sutcliffiella rhizosphaerae]